MHFNIWVGNASFGGVLDPSTLPVQEFISWAQYSAYVDGAFQLQWREEFDGSTLASTWGVGNWASPKNLSTHNPANVNVVDGIAVLSMTADDSTGYTGTPPADSTDGGTTATGVAGASGQTGSGGGCSYGAASATGGRATVPLFVLAALLMVRRRRAWR